MLVVAQGIEELRTLGGTLEAHFAGEPVVELSPGQRVAIESELEPRKAKPKGILSSHRLGWIGLAAASVIGVAVLMHQQRAEPAVGRASAQIFHYALPGSQPVATQPSARQARLEGRCARASEELPDGLTYLGYVGGASHDDGEEPTLMDRDNVDELGAQHVSPNEDYDRIIENAFLLTRDGPLSTFSIDVDTASYANARRMLHDGYLPPADAVRIEEFINYFSYDYGAPTGEHPFHVSVEVGSAPWAPSHRILRIGLQAKQTLPSQRKASNLVFLMDVSGSMDSPDKLPLLKQALHMLVQELDERDTVSIVVYAGASGLALSATRCDNCLQIHMALEGLDAGGSTNGGAGIELAYKQAARNFIRGGINRVILATDGDFNVGVQSDGSLVKLIGEKAKTGVFLSVLGFGSGNLKDSTMEQLAEKGNGNYAYIDSVLEARKVLGEELGSTLETIAKDVKIQVEFNPGQVQAYRLIGYENRMLAAQDFNDDKKDAGEIGAGHHVTALYEVVLQGVPFDTPGVDPLRYQAPGQATDEAFNGELCMLKLRYKQPAGERSILISTPIQDSRANFQELSEDTRWAIESAGPDPAGYRAQFIGLVSRARELMEM